MKPIKTQTDVKHRALLTDSKEFNEKGPDAEITTTRWYDQELPLDTIKKEAKEMGFDLIIMEKCEITMTSYGVEDED